MSNYILKNSHGKKRKSIMKLEKDCIEHLPSELYQFTEEQLKDYGEYLRYLLNDNEEKFIALYEDPQSETYGNKIRTYATVFGQMDYLEEHMSKKYMQVRDNCNQLWNRPRVQAYVKLMRFKKGHDLSQAIPLANSRLIDLIEQVEDKGLTLNAIKELHKILGTTSDGTNIQINNSTTSETLYWDNLTDKELAEYIRLSEKLKKDPNEIG